VFFCGGKGLLPGPVDQVGRDAGCGQTAAADPRLDSAARDGKASCPGGAGDDAAGSSAGAPVATMASAAVAPLVSGISGSSAPAGMINSMPTGKLRGSVKISRLAQRISR
jgi:hypothetical protein